MRMSFFTAGLAGALTLGGCAAVTDGILGDVLGTRGGGYEREGERYAVDACAREAQRYGRVSITQVDRRDNRSYRVRGVIEGNYNERRAFECDVRDDGRITDFDTSRIR